MAQTASAPTPSMSDLAPRQAVCPAGLASARCSFIREEYSSRSFYYFEWAQSACEACAIRRQRLSSRTRQPFRSLQVNEHYMYAQQRRRQGCSVEPQAACRCTSESALSSSRTWAFNRAISRRSSGVSTRTTFLSMWNLP